MSLNAACIPLNAAATNHQAAAIIAGDTVLSYQMLKSQIITCAAVLQEKGIGYGDHVAIMLPNVPQFTINYFAVLYLGARVVPLNVLFVADELAYHLKDSNAKALVVWDAFLDRATPAAKTAGCGIIFACSPPDSEITLGKDVVDQGTSMLQMENDTALSAMQPYATNADDTAVILYTSGTTGRPKGAELTHFNIYDNARYVSERLMRSKYEQLILFSPGDVALAALPLFHSFGQTVIQNGFLMSGAAIALLPRFTPGDAATLIKQHKITFFAGVPSMYIALLNDRSITAESLSSLKYAVSGGAPLPVEVLARFKQQLGIDILEGYGLSETSPVACFNNFIQGCKPGTVGPAIDLCEVRIVDDAGQELPNGEPGEIVIKGTNVMKGYYQKPAETREVLSNGWFHTGDIGICDEAGYISIVDRKKEMIIRGGFNVYPREVEEALYAHPDIVEVAVIGVPDALHGEEVMAIYVLKDQVVLSHAELETFSRQKLAAYKVPRKSEAVASLPKGATGKILKRVLKEKYAPL